MKFTPSGYVIHIRGSAEQPPVPRRHCSRLMASTEVSAIMSDPVQRFHQPAVTLTVTTTSDATVVAATGDLDSTVADRLLGQLSDEIALRPRVVIVDLTRVSFCSTRALSALLTATADAHAAGIPCVIVSDQRAVRRPITALELDHVLQVHDNLAAARRELQFLQGVAEHRHGQPPEGALLRSFRRGGNAAVPSRSLKSGWLVAGRAPAGG
jgi:anti-anti-sigma factor